MDTLMNDQHGTPDTHEANCAFHTGNDPMCVCDHNPGAQCHCPPFECKCDQKHHLVAEKQVGHHCCANDLPHD